MASKSKKVYSIITEKNCEELCARELTERFKVNSTPQTGFVDFEETHEVALKITYFSQSARRVLLKIGNDNFLSLDDLTKKIKKNLKENNDWTDLISNTYRVKCKRLGNHDFNSVIVEQEISKIIKNELDERKIESDADYNSKELIFYLNIENDKYLFGIDYAGKDLSKRHYLFFNNPIAVKGTVAFNLLMFSRYMPGIAFLDCFALAGVIPIEAAIYERNISHNMFAKDFNFPKKLKDENDVLLKKFDLEILEDKFNNVFSCDASFPNLAAQKKNSRIAGVEKNIMFSRTDTRDLDIKNFNKEIDIVCSRIIEPSKKVPERVVINAYNDFFSAAQEFLSKKGTINLMVRSTSLLKDVATKYGFETTKELETAQGQQKLKFIQFKRQK